MHGIEGGGGKSSRVHESGSAAKCHPDSVQTGREVRFPQAPKKKGKEVKKDFYEALNP